MTQPIQWPPSLWAAVSPPGPGWPSLEGVVGTDVVVIGAGFTGLSVALHLARAVTGTHEDDLALPFTAPAPLPMHALARRLAPLMLLLCRLGDRREIAG